MTTSLPQYKRADWGSATWLDPQTCRIRLKNPEGYLTVNTYAYKEENLLLVIDPGWPWTLSALSGALQDLELGPHGLASITHLLYTHSHIDHMGALALLQHQVPAAAHLAYSGVAPWLDHWHAHQDRTNDWVDWALRATCGAHREALTPELRGLQAARAHKTMVARYGPSDLRPLTLFDMGERLEFGSLQLDVVDLRGHDITHVGFLNPHTQGLYSGDCVLAVPTPLSPPMHDDLDLYEATLTRLRDLPLEALYIGHGTHVQGRPDVQAAIDRSHTFLSTLRSRVLRTIERAAAPIGMWELALRLTPDGQRFEHAARWWVHVALVDTHLQWWVHQGDLERVEEADGPRYRAL